MRELRDLALDRCILFNELVGVPELIRVAQLYSREVLVEEKWAAPQDSSKVK